MEQLGTPNDTPKSGSQLALLHDAQRLMDAVQVMGRKVGKIACYDQRNYVDLVDLLAQNKKSPGAFADAVLSIKITDKAGRSRRVVREGRVKQLLIELSRTGDMMNGLTRKRIARLFEVSPTDKTLDSVIHALRDLCKSYLGLGLGSHNGKVKVLTQQALSQKNEFRATMALGLAQNAEEDGVVFRQQGILPLGRQSVEIELFSVPADDDRDLS